MYEREKKKMTRKINTGIEIRTFLELGQLLEGIQLVVVMSSIFQLVVTICRMLISILNLHNVLLKI